MIAEALLLMLAQTAIAFGAGYIIASVKLSDEIAALRATVRYLEQYDLRPPMLESAEVIQMSEYRQ